MAEKNVSVGSRGTSRRSLRKDDRTASGPAFSNLWDKRKTQSAGRFISVGRGTGKIKFEDIGSSTGKSTGKGMWVRTGRGTGKRLIK